MVAALFMHLVIVGYHAASQMQAAMLCIHVQVVGCMCQLMPSFVCLYGIQQRNWDSDGVKANSPDIAKDTVYSVFSNVRTLRSGSSNGNAGQIHSSTIRGDEGQCIMPICICLSLLWTDDHCMLLSRLTNTVLNR